jgi:hypothetical protein
LTGFPQKLFNIEQGSYAINSDGIFVFPLIS